MHIYRSLIMFDHVIGWAIVWGWAKPFGSIPIGSRGLVCSTLSLE